MNFPAVIAVFVALLQVPVSIPATFTGVFRSIESGRVVIEVENGQNMRMFITGSTKFIRDGKPSKASAFHDGDPVTVDAERDVRMNMVAVRVEAIKPAAKKPAEPADDSEKATEKRN
jgi:hypothetical protein